MGRVPKRGPTVVLGPTTIVALTAVVRLATTDQIEFLFSEFANVVG